jgi:hypothetical protein
MMLFRKENLYEYFLTVTKCPSCALSALRSLHGPWADRCIFWAPGIFHTAYVLVVHATAIAPNGRACQSAMPQLNQEDVPGQLQRQLCRHLHQGVNFYFFETKAKDLPYSLRRRTEFGQFINGKPAENRNKSPQRPTKNSRREGKPSHPGYPHKLLEAQVGLCQTDDTSSRDRRLRFCRQAPERRCARSASEKNITTRSPLEGHRTPLS